MASTGWAFAGLSRLEGAAGRAQARRGPFADPTGAVALASGDEAVRQAILILLSTRPGERVMRPDYGCPIHRLVFSPNDATTAGLAIHYVRQALLRFEPRVEIMRLDAGPAPAGSPDEGDGATLHISLEYRVRVTQRRERLQFSLDLNGAAA